MKKTQRSTALISFALSAIAMAALVSGCSPSGNAGDFPGAAGTAYAAAAALPKNGPVAVARGKIDVEGGLLELGPGVEGMVQQLPIREGQHVQRGQLLLRMADDASRADLSVAESEWKLAQARQKAKAARLPQLQAMLKRWQTAVREGAADAHSLDEAAQQLRDAESEADVARAEVQVALAKVEQLRSTRKRFELNAPEAGTIVRLRTHAGSQAGPSQPVITLLPQSPLIVRAELNESFAGAVHEGMRATVAIDGDTGAMAIALPEAKVQRISPVFGVAHLQEDTQRGPIRVIECVLSFNQPPTGARMGQNVRVTFHE